MPTLERAIRPEDVLLQQHQDWLSNPVTQQYIKNLRLYRESFVKTLSAGAGNNLEPEVMFRINSYGIRCADAIIAMTTDSSKFIEQSNKIITNK